MHLSENVKIAINEMFRCRSLLEHIACYQHYNKELRDWTFVVFSEGEGSKLPDALCTNYDNKFAVINLGCTDQYYAVNQQIYEEMLGTCQSDYYIDVCVELDTQAVSYLKNIFCEYNQIPDYEGIKDLVQYLQLPEVNYSCLPYLVENAAKKDTINKIECYKNIKSYILFKAFDYKRTLQEGKCRYNSAEEEIQLDTDGLYNDMFSEKFVQYYGKFFEMQKSIYILLLKAICIEFTNSKKSAQNKMLELIDFVNEELGFVAERELEVCYHYFDHDDKTKKFFKKVQKNSNHLLDIVHGMAWDLVHIRLVEKEFLTILVEDVRYAIHMLLTFDNGLKEVLKINPIEQIAFSNGIVIPKLKNRWLDEIPGAQQKIKDEENEKQRHRIFETRNVEKLRKNVEEELQGVCMEM